MERWQVPLYLVAIGVGMVIGLMVGDPATDAEAAINPLLAALLFVTFLQVPIAELAESLRDRRFLAAITTLNFVVVPLVLTIATRFLPADTAIRLGVLLVLLCPCVDYVVVFTGLAGGAAQRLLAATPLLLLAQLVLTPLYLYAFLGSEMSDVIDPRPFLTAFVVLIVIPLGLAWAAQTVAARHHWGRTFEAAAGTTMVPLMVLVLATVVGTQVPRIDDRLGDLVGVAPIFAAFLIVMAGAGVLIGRIFGLSTDRARAAVFSGATRNSLVVLPLALALPAGYELAGAVVITQTLVELVGMVAFVWAIPRLLPQPSPTGRAESAE
ncbi:bile acid:sodium symporter [Gordonia sp. ABSL1-1]|uniref:arsenic resistance protein n=1 Tax=Gordonia sp. ABSL1-1 TaxID=3053923 RepID=UPI002572DA32|nr:bile acid:sodium symporter [Gordonia sp. ABSL1-1]MDL9938814.1 bile acid:sodium symporter [Gordonia sp. ABSL1-1]